MSLIQMSFAGTIMILAVIAVRALTINRLPKKVFVLLWAAVLLRLLIPFSIPSVLSAYSFVGRNESIQAPLANTPVDNMIPRTVEGQIDKDVVTVQALQGNVLGFSVWQVVWIAGVILCAVFFIISYLRCYSEFRTSLPVCNEFAAKWLEEHPLKRSVQIRQSDQISTPLTYGILKPVVLMPKRTDWEDGQQLKYVLSHEYIHIRNFDMVWKWIVVAALCVHWFNPAVWAMYIFFNRDIELSCDESVVRQFGDTSKVSYAKALITMEEKRRGLPSLCNNFSKNAIEKRIVAIMKTRKRTVWAVMIGAVILAAVVILFATSAENRTVSNRDDGMVEEAVKTEGDRTEAGEMADEGAETEQRTVTVMTIIGTDAPVVPDVVLNVAKQSIAERLTSDYGDLRIEAVEHVYTYEELLGMTLQVYRTNYQILSNDPENLLLMGGMTIDEDGWVVPEYPNSTYHIIQQEREELSYLMTMIENDCFPGDEVFTNDLKNKIDAITISGKTE